MLPSYVIGTAVACQINSTAVVSYAGASWCQSVRNDFLVASASPTVRTDTVACGASGHRTTSSRPMSPAVPRFSSHGYTTYQIPALPTGTACPQSMASCFRAVRSSGARNHTAASITLSFTVHPIRTRGERVGSGVLRGLGLRGEFAGRRGGARGERVGSCVFRGELGRVCRGEGLGDLGDLGEWSTTCS